MPPENPIPNFPIVPSQPKITLLQAAAQTTNKLKICTLVLENGNICGKIGSTDRKYLYNGSCETTMRDRCIEHVSQVSKVSNTQKTCNITTENGDICGLNVRVIWRPRKHGGIEMIVKDYCDEHLSQLEEEQSNSSSNLSQNLPKSKTSSRSLSKSSSNLSQLALEDKSDLSTLSQKLPKSKNSKSSKLSQSLSPLSQLALEDKSDSSTLSQLSKSSDLDANLFKIVSGELSNHHGESQNTSLDISAPECDICHRVFTRKDTIDRHKINVHFKNILPPDFKTTIPIKQCHICNKTFQSKEMKMHMEKDHHKAEDVILVPCHICKENINETKLKKHIKTVHEGGNNCKTLALIS